jgi:nucleotide-binding universal stress UspA family protein
MFGPVKSLLFATNLAENCRPALEASIATATEYQATLILLHVLDKELPSQIEEHLKSVLGAEKWEALMAEHEKDARDALIGKMTSGKIAQRAMRMYCEDAGIDRDACSFQYRELVVSDSHIADTIVSQAREHGCDLIIMGAQKGFMSGNTIGSVIKGVLRKAQVPVMVVPPRQAAQEAAS